MNVSLTPRLENLIHNDVENGLYNNASEVVREALRDFYENRLNSPRARLKAALDIGWHEAETGQTVPLTRELFDRLTDEGRQMALNGEPLDPDVAPFD